MQVLLEPTDEGVRASTGAPLNLSVEGTTEAEALTRLEREVSNRFSTGARLVELAVEGAKPVNPLAELAGDMKDDPLFEAWCDSMREYRRERDAELAREEPQAT